MKKISIVTGCYNERGNITELYERITATMGQLPQYDYEIMCIDNCSTDGTRDEIRAICAKDKRFKAIFNVRNFGPVRSGAHLLYQAAGDAVIALASDLEDPPEMIPQFIERWEQGFKLVWAARQKSDERGVMPLFRRAYYALLRRIAQVKQLSWATGFGLYDRIVMDALREMRDPYPYIRGLVFELGWPIAVVPFNKPVRKRGVSSYNIFRYIDYGMLGIVNSSRLPLRIASYMGVAVSIFSFILGSYYCLQKFLHWNEFQFGQAPLLVGLFFLMGLMFLFMGLIGEYVGLVITHVVRRPMVVEEERFNMPPQDPPGAL
jgi:glycosyltransferase involved in cell wall biosynthesis